MHQDKHNDITADWIYNEVTIDYNAAFVGACAGLYDYYGTDAMEITPIFRRKTRIPEMRAAMISG